MNLLKEDPFLTQQEVATQLGIGFDTAKEYFSKLKNENRIQRMGGRKKGYWQIL